MHRPAGVSVPARAENREGRSVAQTAESAPLGPFHAVLPCLHMARTMSATTPDFANRLRAAGLRPTRQRVALARVLFESGHRHVTAESLHAEVKATRIPVSL